MIYRPVMIKLDLFICVAHHENMFPFKRCYTIHSKSIAAQNFVPRSVGDPEKVLLSLLI